MTLMPLFGAPDTTTKTINPANELDISGEVSGTPVDMFWEDTTTLRVMTSSGIVYTFETPVAGRVGSLAKTNQRTLTESVTGSPSFYGFCIYGGNYFALRANGGGEANFHIEKFNSSGVAQQKLDIGGTADGSLRFNAAGTKLFYQNDEVISERTMSSAGDLSTAGSATTHTFTGFTESKGFDFNSAGTQLVFVEATPDDDVRNYTLSTAFNPGSATLDGTTSYDPLTSFNLNNIALFDSDTVTVGDNTLYKLEI